MPTGYGLFGHAGLANVASGVPDCPRAFGEPELICKSDGVIGMARSTL